MKVHQLNSGWAESKKAAYVRHAVREYNIHRHLAHARIVALLDIFEVDPNTFATVLALCPGGELERHLLEHQVRAGYDLMLLLTLLDSVEASARALPGRRPGAPPARAPGAGRILSHAGTIKSHWRCGVPLGEDKVPVRTVQHCMCA